mgnify:CR=1 FL=1
MITALQNFISKRSKLLFPLLLLVITVSFVLYLSQGSSVFDLLPDPNYESKQLYGVDLNDPDKRRVVNLSNRVASDFGAIVSPTEPAMGNADRRFIENLQSQIQTAIRSNQENIDRNQLQQMFEFMQQWPNLPKQIKIREIARSGLYDFEFSESSFQAKITLDGLAESWGFLPLSLNHNDINIYFDKFVKSLSPGLSDDRNRTLAMRNVGQRHGFSSRDTETILYSHFRALRVDENIAQGGLSLAEEAQLDLHGEQFAWDAEVYSLQSDDLNLSDPRLSTLQFERNPKAGTVLKLSYASKNLTFEFSSEEKDSNGSTRYVRIGDSIAASVSALKSAIEKEKFGLKIEIEPDAISFVPKKDNLPSSKPSIVTDANEIKIAVDLMTDLLAYHKENENDSVFAEPERTLATALTFPTKNFLSVPPLPDEARMKSYFERNKYQFDPPVPEPNEEADGNSSKGAKGPIGDEDNNSSDLNGSQTDGVTLDLLAELEEDANRSQAQEVTFEEVRDQVRQKIIDGDLINAERYAETASRDAALAFLDAINSLQDKLRYKYATYSERRNSPELKALIEEHQATTRSISFADRDMAVQGSILGLERRESEKRANREPLEEVKSLTERNFFTRSVRNARDGYLVFLFDRTTPSGPGQYSSASFRDLYLGFAEEQTREAFLGKADQILASLDEQNASLSGLGLKVSISRKSSSGVRAGYDKENRSLSSKLTEFQNERAEIGNSERENNASAEQLARKLVLDQRINEIRDQQAVLNRERSIAVRLADACISLLPMGPWEEIERTDSSVLFARLKTVYSMRPKVAKSDELSERVLYLEYARAENTRSKIIQDLIDKELAR